MAAPTLVNTYESSWSTTGGSKTLMSSVSISSGDVIVVVAVIENDVGTLGVSENGSSSFSTILSNSGNAPASMWVYTATTNETITVSITNSDSGTYWGGAAFHFTDTDGVGTNNNAANTSGDPSVTLSSVSANSAIVMIVSDWNAVIGTQVAYTASAGSLTNDVGYPGDNSHYGVYGGVYEDAGAAGNKTIGQTDPNGLDWTICGIEIQGSAGATTNEQSFTSNSVIKKTLSQTFTADSLIQKTFEQNFTADSLILKVFQQTFSADATIQKAIEQSFVADAVIQKTTEQSFTADAVIQKTFSQTFTANSVIQKLFSQTLTADAVIVKTLEQSFTADAVIKKSFSQTLAADAILLKSFSQTFTTDSIIQKTLQQQFTAEAFIVTTGANIIPLIVHHMKQQGMS